MKTKTNVQDWLIRSANQLNHLSDSANLEVQVILAHAMNRPREWLFAHPEGFLTEDEIDRAELLFNRLKMGEPLAYLIGKRSFFGREYSITTDVLVPRPETELLIEECIHWLSAHPEKRSAADVGTGSGIIAISLACEFNDLTITAIDLSEKALEVASKNALQHRVSRQIKFVQNDLFNNLSGGYDLIAANLPYIPSGSLKKLPVSKFEPTLALDGGKDGLALIDRLIRQSNDHLNEGGLLILEIEETQADIVAEKAKKNLKGREICILNDLANHPRIVKINY